MGVRFGNACEKSGINLVRFDFTNVGLSEGDFFYSTKQERINDTIEVINHVISFFDKKIKIFILGFCDGANIAAGAFNNINIEINKLIFWNPNILFNKENDKNDEINITYISKINKYCIDFQGVYMNFMFYKDIIHNQLFDFIINNEEYCHIFF